MRTAPMLHLVSFILSTYHTVVSLLAYLSRSFMQFSPIFSCRRIVLIMLCLLYGELDAR